MLAAAHVFLGVTSTEFGQSLLGLLVAFIGYVLHRKTHASTS